MELFNQIKEAYKYAEDKITFINSVKKVLHDLSPIQQPVDFVQWVAVDMIEPNDYNPNSVAREEMNLLYKSIKQDGYTQPIVTIYDSEKGKYVIVDGFHRYFTGKSNKDILERNYGMLPIVVIKKDINERMAATVRHNRARGAHSVKGMANMVFEMLDNGWLDSDICNQLGMEADELVKIKHITGFSKLFKNTEYSKAWETKNQIKYRIEAEKKQKSE